MSTRYQTQTNKIYTTIVDVNTNAVGFVLGKGRQNLNEIRTAFPDVKIWITQHGSLTNFNLSSNSANKLESCSDAMVKLKNKGESIYESIAQRKKIEKHIELQRRSIIASKRIKETLETEMRVKHRENVQKKIVEAMQQPSTINEELDDTLDLTVIKEKNMFGGLEVE